MSLLRYIERCTGANHNGPAWIGYVEESKSGQTIYFNGLGLVRSQNHGGAGNFSDVETGESYWVSGVKRRGTNRHWAGSGSIAIEKAAIPEFLELAGETELDPRKFTICDEFAKTDRARLHDFENRRLS